MRKILCLVAAVLFLTSGTMTAKADSFIDSWTYSVSGIFSEWTSSAMADGYGIYAADAETLGGTSGYHDLSWGPKDISIPGGPGNNNIVIIDNYDSRSSITLSDTVNGTVYTDGANGLGFELTHRNKNISAFPTLTSGKIYMTLTLEASVGGEVLSFDTTLSFDFIETPNTGSLKNDIFLIKNPQTSMGSFEYDGYWYTFSFDSSFVNLNEEYPAYVRRYLDPNAENHGWITEEDKTTIVQTYLAVRSGKLTPTPEPGTILLMGAGLVGLVLVARRRME